MFQLGGKGEVEVGLQWRMYFLDFSGTKTKDPPPHQIIYSNQFLMPTDLLKTVISSQKCFSGDTGIFLPNPPTIRHFMSLYMLSWRGGCLGEKRQATKPSCSKIVENPEKWIRNYAGIHHAGVTGEILNKIPLNGPRAIEPYCLLNNFIKFMY